jgi:hypothetical protein
VVKNELTLHIEHQGMGDYIAVRSPLLNGLHFLQVGLIFISGLVERIFINQDLDEGSLETHIRLEAYPLTKTVIFRL